MLVGTRQKVLGVVAVADTLREESVASLSALRKSGVRTIAMLTGDNERTAKAIGAQAGKKLGLEGEDAAAGVRVVALREILDQVEADVIALDRGKPVETEAVAGGAHCFGEKQQAIADDVDGAVRVADPVIGREREVGGRVHALREPV